MNETLKGVANIGAELAAAKADLQREMERHRKTWRQLEQAQRENAALKKLLDRANERMDELKSGALSQQAEPVEPAPAQDEQHSVIAHIELCITNLKAEHQTNPRVIAEVLYNIGYSRATRPAQTEQQPEQSGLVGQVCGGDGTHNTVNVAVVGAVPWGELRIGTPVRLIPAPATPSPATAPSHE